MPYYNSTLGCFSDIGVCCDTACCYCFQVGRQLNAIEGNVNQHDCFKCCIGMCCSPFMGCCLRCKVSDKYQLEEGVIKSCCCGALCNPCSVCMTGRELNYLGANPGGCLCTPSGTGGMQ